MFTDFPHFFLFRSFKYVWTEHAFRYIDIIASRIRNWIKKFVKMISHTFWFCSFSNGFTIIVYMKDWTRPQISLNKLTKLCRIEHNVLTLLFDIYFLKLIFFIISSTKLWNVLHFLNNFIYFQEKMVYTEHLNSFSLFQPFAISCFW